MSGKLSNEQFKKLIGNKYAVDDDKITKKYNCYVSVLDENY